MYDLYGALIGNLSNYLYTYILIREYEKISVNKILL